MKSAERFVIPDAIKTIADACSNHYRASTRYWIFSATFILFLYTTKIDGETVRFLGYQMDSQYLYPTCFGLLALINIGFCSIHIQAYRMSLILHDLLMSMNADKAFSNKFSLADIAHGLYIPALNRVFPLTHSVGGILKSIVYKLFKIPGDVFFYGLPIFGCWYAFSKIDEIWAWWLSWLFALTSIASILLLFQTLKWTFYGPKKLLEKMKKIKN